MNISNSKKVNEFLLDIASLSPEQFEIIILIRGLFIEANIDLVEDIKYGGLVFSLSDDLVGGIFAYKGHISIEFSNGAEFADANAVLEGGGKKRRHIKIHSKKDVAHKSLEYFIQQAVGN